VGEWGTPADQRQTWKTIGPEQRVTHSRLAAKFASDSRKGVLPAPVSGGRPEKMQKDD